MNPQVKDFTSYNTRKKESLNPEDNSLSNTAFRHLKMLDLLDENGFRIFETLREWCRTHSNVVAEGPTSTLQKLASN